ncbi:Predicted arabinose efflux permease, MFS family [Burkholderia sp. OK233]|nr:Predicted arabinose efflux permease, MFS family [Burkholderia sp. OK233]
MGHTLSTSEKYGSRTSRSRLLVVTTIGNALEFFDFTVFGYFAIVIGRLFFAPMSAEGQLMSSLATFGVGFLMRPLGGVVFGIYADRAGRRAAMTLTLTLMMVGVCLAGLAPTYAQVGIAGPILMVLARLIQGLSAGGEVGPATTLLLEHAPAGSRAFYTSWQLGSQGLGIAAGAASAALLTHFLPEEQLYAWGWRLPFLLGAAILPVGIALRRQLSEIETEYPQSTTGSDSAIPLRDLFHSHFRHLAAGVLLIMGATVAAYLITFFIPTYSIRDLKLGESASYACAVASGIVIAIVAPIAGKVTDRVGRKIPIVFARLLLIASLYPMYAWLSSAPTAGRLLVTVVFLSVLLTIQGAATISLIPVLFPRHVRATGTGTVYSFGVALFGGSTQLAAVWLISATGNRLSPAIATTAVLIVSTLSLLLIGSEADAET